MTITSPAFENEAWMPNEYSGYGEDVSPELHIDGIPQSAASLIVTLDDLGHPIHPGYNHWIAWNIEPTAVIPKGIPKGEEVEQPIHIEQGMAYGKHCYRGPKPPFNRNHRYRFTVYALDCRLSVASNADKAAVLAVAEGHVLAVGELFGKYQKKHM